MLSPTLRRGIRVCLDSDGQVVQVCISPLGLHPRLCCCEHMIIGVDHRENGWRLWNWPVLQQDTLQTVVSLETDCQRAFVHAEPHAGRFWLLEERQDGIHVTHRDAQTLAEIASSAFIAGASLMPGQEETRPLDGYRDVGIVPYRDTLLLLVAHNTKEIVLYQIR